MNRGLLASLAAIAAVLTAAGCGTTVSDQEAAANGATGTQSLAAPNGASTSSAPGSSNGVTGVMTTGGATSGGTVATVAGNGQSATSTSTGGTFTGPTADGATAPGNGPGVTDTTINVAAAYDPDAAAGDAALGAADANPGDIKAETEAIIKYVNAHGGIAHRKVNPIWYKASVKDQSATTDQQACETWTRDHKTFVIAAGDPLLDECTARAGGIAVLAGAIEMETTAQNRKYPQDINLTSFTIDRAMTVTMNGLEHAGYFSRDAKVGVVTWDDPYFTYGIKAAAVPALHRLGYDNVPVQYIATPQSYGDLGATSAAVSSAVLKFQGAGIDHVILLDGPAGVNNSGILCLEWMQQANSQHYYPRYGMNSTSGFNALAADYPTASMANSVGVGWQPALEATSEDYAKFPIPETGKICLQIMKDAGQQQSGANAQAIQLALCDTFFFLKRTLDTVRGPLNRQTAMAAINAIGTGFKSSVTFGVNINANKHDGGDLVRDVAFVGSCTCYRYTSAPYNPL